MTASYPYLSELYLDNENSDIMHVSVGLDGYEPETIDFPVSLSYMGIDWDGDDSFEMEFSKDLIRDMIHFYDQNHRIPTPEEYKALTEQHYYGMI